MTIEWLVVIIWFLCGFIHYGLFVGYFQNKYVTIAKETLKSDRLIAAILAVGGPIALASTLLHTHRPYNWKL